MKRRIKMRNKKISLIILATGLAVAAGFVIGMGGWFGKEDKGFSSALLPEWKYRRPITISGQTENLTDYQVKIELPSSLTSDLVSDGKLQSDFSDVRFTDANDTQLLNYWIERATTTATSVIWVKVPSLSANKQSTIYMYYGNPSASSESNGDAVFDFFDDFDEGDVETVDYFASNGIGRATHGIIAPHGTYYNNKTFIVWQGTNLDPYAIEYNHTTGEWSDPVRVGDNPLSSDDHGAPAILRDANGYLHVFYGCHGTSGCSGDACYIQHAKSNSPDDISAWTDKGNICAYRATYPNPILISSDIYLFYRLNAGTNWFKEVYSKSTDNGETWGSENDVIDFGTGYAIYVGRIEAEGTSKIHISWVVYDYSDSKRKNVYHAYLNLSDLHMYAMDGTDLGTTIDKTEADSHCLVLDSGTAETNLAKVHLDSSGTPYIIFLHDDNGWKVKFTKWNGSSWDTPTTITSTDNQFNSHDFIVHSSSNIELYLTAGGSAEQGGDIEKWSWNGSTWTKDSTVLSESTFGKPLNCPVIVENYNSNLKVVFSEYTGDYTTPLKVFAFGDSGIVQGKELRLDTSKWTVDTTVTSYSVANSKLTIDGCADSQWGVLKGIYTSFPLQSGFTVEVKDFTWSEAGASNMPKVGITLTDGTSWDAPIAEHFNDAWSGSSAQKKAYIEENSYGSGAGTLALSGTAQFKITKLSDNNAQVYWDGTSILGPYTSTTTISKLYILVNKYSTNAFGTFTIDRIIVRKYASPEPSATIGDEETQKTPIAHWRFEEGSGNIAYDSTPNNNDCTISGASFVTGKFGSALSFEGTDYALTTGALDSLTTFSYSLWFKPSQIPPSQNQYLFNQGTDDPSVYLDTSGNLNIKLNSTLKLQVPSSKLQVQNWHHLEITGSGSILKAYLNGVLIGSANYSGSTANDYLYLGSASSTAGFFNGLIDDFRIYNYARSQNEVALDYNYGLAVKLGGSPGTSTPPILEFRFEEGSGNLVYNNSKPATGWKKDWKYYLPITISNSTSTLTDYQVLVTVDTQSLISANKMRSDCGNIRFGDESGRNLSYWLEEGCNTTSTKIWVKVPQIPTSGTTIYMYYGNPSATSESNGTAVFEFFDDFEPDSDKWTGTGTYGTTNEGYTFASQTGNGTSTSTLTSNIIGSGTFKATLKIKSSGSAETNCSYAHELRQVNSSGETVLDSSAYSSYTENTYDLSGENVKLKLYVSATGYGETITDTLILRPNGTGSETSISYQYPSTGSHYDKVDEATPDDNSTYVYVYNNINSYERDLYALQDHSTESGDINKITVYYRVGCYPEGDQCEPCYGTLFRPSIRTHSTTYDGTEQSGASCIPVNGYSTYSQEWTTNPYTGNAWTWDEIDALEAGVNLNGGEWADVLELRCTQVYVEVTYTTSAYSASSSLYVDDVYVRKYVSPEPSVSVGAEKPNQPLGQINLSLSNSQMWSSNGKFGSALSFEGTDYASTTCPLDSLTEFSYSLWFKPSQIPPSQNQYLFNQGTDDPSVYLDTSGNLNIKLNSTLKLQVPGSKIKVQNWHHLEITGNGSILKAYLNGVLIGSANYSGSTANDYLYLGSASSTAGFFSGLIDDFRIYNYERTQPDVLVDYKAGLGIKLGGSPGTTIPSTHYWRLNTGIGNTAVDGTKPTTGWKPNWQYYKTITITNSGFQSLTDYQILITLDTSALISANKMRSDCGDIRFGDESGRNLPYWLEEGCNTTSTKIWVKVPQIPTSGTTIYLYYGNPSATSESDGSAVFEFFDDFETDTTGDYTWTTVDSSSPTNSHNWNSANKWVEIRTGDNDEESPSKSITLPSSGYAKIVFIKRTDYPADNTQELDVKQDDNNYYRFRWCGSSYSFQGVYKVVGGTTTDSSEETGTVNTNNQEYTIEMWWTPTLLRLDIDGITRKNITTTNTTEISPSSFYFYNEQIDCDWESIIIRKYASPEPSVSVGGERTNQPVGLKNLTLNPGTGGTNTTANQMWTNGIFGKGIEFDGTDDYLSAGDIGNLQTLSFWLAPFNLNQKILQLNSTDYIELVNGVITLQGSGWSNAKIYINGELKAQNAELQPPSSKLQSYQWYHIEIVNSSQISATSTTFGKVSVGATDYYFSGLIDEIISYDYARDPADVKVDYNAGFGIFFK